MAILGTGCLKCRQTVDVVRKAVEQAGIDATIRKVEDLMENMEYRVMTAPAVAVDGKVKIAGRVPIVEGVKALLRQGSTS